MQDSRPILLASTDFPSISRRELNTLQVNLGYRCNLSCVHCHVSAGPNRTEEMVKETADLLLEVIDKNKIKTLDLTGGAPELNDNFRRIVQYARKRNIEVIDRCNLTVLFEDGQQDLAEFLAQNQVTITASLPCYEEENVKEQRGKGVYESSIEALQKLNALGYGKEASLQLNLVYNPVGPVLPPAQGNLESDYKKQLGDKFGIVFNHLFTITNMPIQRFGAILLAKGQYDEYMNLLRNNYAESNLNALMCRELLSVDWQGYLYDCDFNQMLDMPVLSLKGPGRPHLKDLLNDNYVGNSIKVADHCYGCTAGSGSSCGGALN